MAPMMPPMTMAPMMGLPEAMPEAMTSDAASDADADADADSDDSSGCTPEPVPSQYEAFENVSSLAVLLMGSLCHIYCFSCLYVCAVCMTTDLHDLT